MPPSRLRLGEKRSLGAGKEAMVREDFGLEVGIIREYELGRMMWL
jgi:hypothetical protein